MRSGPIETYDLRLRRSARTSPLDSRRMRHVMRFFVYVWSRMDETNHD